MKRIINGICLAFLLTHCTSAPTTAHEAKTDATNTVVEMDSLMNKAGLVEELKKMGYSEEEAKRMANEAEIHRGIDSTGVEVE